MGRIQPFIPRSVEKRGDQSRFKSLGLYIHIVRSRYVAVGPDARAEVAEVLLVVVHAHAGEPPVIVACGRKGRQFASFFKFVPSLSWQIEWSRFIAKEIEWQPPRKKKAFPHRDKGSAQR